MSDGNTGIGMKVLEGAAFGLGLILIAAAMRVAFHLGFCG